MPVSAAMRDHAAGPPTPLLSTVTLGCQRGERPLFSGVELALRPGQLIWLRGRNGRGKTSLLRLLAGLATPAHGDVLCDGLPLRRQSTQWRRRLLYIAHANALKDDLTVGESLAFLGAVHGSRPTGEDIDAALATLGIAHLRHAPGRTLSQGQRRRAALARLALPQSPSIWLLDEPFDALDDEAVHALSRLLSGHARRGGSAIFTSHQAVALHDPVPEILDLDEFAIAA